MSRETEPETLSSCGSSPRCGWRDAMTFMHTPTLKSRLRAQAILFVSNRSKGYLPGSAE